MGAMIIGIILGLIVGLIIAPAIGVTPLIGIIVAVIAPYFIAAL